MENMENLLQKRLTEHAELIRKMKQDADFYENAIKAAIIILKALREGGALYLCGNGGSAADAQHIATEFVSRFYNDRNAYNAEALTVNTSSLTAIGNDYGFERVFSRQLEAKGHSGDVLIGISTSGTSANVVNAIKYASENGIHTILLTGGMDIDYDPSIYECVIRIPSTEVPRIQEAHICVGHILAEYVERELEIGGQIYE